MPVCAGVSEGCQKPGVGHEGVQIQINIWCASFSRLCRGGSRRVRRRHAPRGRLWIRGTPRRTHAAAHAAALPCKPGAMCAQFSELTPETQRAVRQRMCVSAVCSWSLLLGAIYLGYALLFGRGLGSSGGGTQVGRRLNAGTPGRLSTARARFAAAAVRAPAWPAAAVGWVSHVLCVVPVASCPCSSARRFALAVSQSLHCVGVPAAFANAQRGACEGGFGRHPGLVSGTLAR